MEVIFHFIEVVSDALIYSTLLLVPSDNTAPAVLPAHSGHMRMLVSCLLSIYSIIKHMATKKYDLTQTSQNHNLVKNQHFKMYSSQPGNLHFQENVRIQLSQYFSVCRFFLFLLNTVYQYVTHTELLSELWVHWVQCWIGLQWSVLSQSIPFHSMHTGSSGNTPAEDPEHGLNIFLCTVIHVHWTEGLRKLWITMKC